MLTARSGSTRRLGWREDADFVISEDYRILQFTPTGSQASIIFGAGVTAAVPGSIDGLLLAVDDIDAAREQLLARGVEVSEVFHDAGGGLGGGFHAGAGGRAQGLDPQGRSYAVWWSPAEIRQAPVRTRSSATRWTARGGTGSRAC